MLVGSTIVALVVAHKIDDAFDGNVLSLPPRVVAVASLHVAVPPQPLSSDLLFDFSDSEFVQRFFVSDPIF